MVKPPTLKKVQAFLHHRKIESMRIRLNTKIPVYGKIKANQLFTFGEGIRANSLSKLLELVRKSGYGCSVSGNAISCVSFEVSPNQWVRYKDLDSAPLCPPIPTIDLTENLFSEKNFPLPEENKTCSICLELLSTGKSTLSCGHEFCILCLSNWLNSGRSIKTCPNCRSVIQ